MRTDPNSPFTGALAIMRHFPDRVESLVNRTRRTLTAAGVAEREIADEAAFRETLRDLFRLDHPDAAALWAKTGDVLARTDLAA